MKWFGVISDFGFVTKKKKKLDQNSDFWNVNIEDTGNNKTCAHTCFFAVTNLSHTTAWILALLSSHPRPGSWPCCPRTTTNPSMPPFDHAWWNSNTWKWIDKNVAHHPWHLNRTKAKQTTQGSQLSILHRKHVATENIWIAQERNKWNRVARKCNISFTNHSANQMMIRNMARIE